MAVFPESSPTPVYPLMFEQEWSTLIRETASNEQRRRNRLFPVYNGSVRYEAVTAAEIDTLWNFHKARSGAFGTFHIYDLGLLAGNEASHVGEYVATADGAEDTFDIPGRGTYAQEIYVDGVQQTVTTDYTILAGGGDADSDRVQFVSAPSAGGIVTADFTGYLRMLVRFARDAMSKELFVRALYRTGLEMKGVRPWT